MADDINPAETAQTPASEPIAEPQGETPSEPTKPVSEGVQETSSAAAEPQQSEPQQAPQTQSAATAASAPSATSNSNNSAQHDRELLVQARAKIQTKKSVKLGKIMTELERKGKITNDEVEKLLHVSDATATRYLSALEKQGKIKQEGKTGEGVAYIKS